jgi:hypothetical protein
MNAQDVAKAARFTVGDHVRIAPSTVMWTVTHCYWDDDNGIIYDLRAFDLHLLQIQEDRLVFAGRTVPLLRPINGSRGAST